MCYVNNVSTTLTVREYRYTMRVYMFVVQTVSACARQMTTVSSTPLNQTTLVPSCSSVMSILVLQTRVATPNGYDWRTAFILSLLLSGTGAANFYIGRYDLAVPQLFLLLLAFVIQIILICFRLCTRNKKVDEDGYLCVMCCAAMVLTILLFVVVLTGITWWVVDAVLIYLNQRLDGNGCYLSKSS